MATKREQLEKLVADTQTFADEIDARGTQTAEETAKLTAMLNDIKSLSEQVKAEAEAKGALNDAKSFLSSLAGPADEKQAARPSLTVAGLPAQPKGQTLGEMFVASPAFADFKARYGGRDGVIPESTKGLQSSPFQTPDLKVLLTGASDTSAGAGVRNDLYAPVTDLIGQRELSLRDLVTIGQTGSDTVEYVRVTAKTNNAAPVAEATSSATVGDGLGGTVLPAAGGVKPESSIALEKVSTTVKTIAHWMPLTKRAASDAPQVRTLVDNFLRYGLEEELEDQILTGSGSGENFTGILNSSPSTVGSAGTDLDAIVDAIRTVRVTGRRRPNAIVMHPNDWYSTGFLLSKDSQGRYLVGDPRASLDQLNQLWGLRVVVTEAMTENTALVGDFRQAVLWEREGITLSVTDSHSDFFTRNLLAVLAEMRAAFGVLDPQAFCTVTAV